MLDDTGTGSRIPHLVIRRVAQHVVNTARATSTKDLYDEVRDIVVAVLRKVGAVGQIDPHDRHEPPSQPIDDGTLNIWVRKLDVLSEATIDRDCDT